MKKHVFTEILRINETILTLGIDKADDSEPLSGDSKLLGFVV
ncbi:MAG: hypothetical protein AAF802_12970 [Planctomycetota bacterium]